MLREGGVCQTGATQSCCQCAPAASASPGVQRQPRSTAPQRRGGEEEEEAEQEEKEVLQAWVTSSVWRTIPKGPRARPGLVFPSESARPAPRPGRHLPAHHHRPPPAGAATASALRSALVTAAALRPQLWHSTLNIFRQEGANTLPLSPTPSSSCVALSPHQYPP